MNPLRIALVGATGRMGGVLIRCIAADPAFQLAAAVTISDDPRLGTDAGRTAGLDDLGVPLTADITVPVDVVIEFTGPAGCLAWSAWAAEHKVPFVSGATGLNPDQRAKLAEHAKKIPIVWAPNMSVGVNLMLAMVEKLAAQLDPTWDIEVVESHHRKKVDAPSGTAVAIVEAACRGRQVTPADTVVHGREGVIGPRPAGQIGVHALRQGSIVGEHEISFTSEAESLAIRHRAFSRETFAQGALRAARWLATRPAGLYTMRDVLGI